MLRTLVVLAEDQIWFPDPRGNSQLLVTQVPGDLIPSGLHGYHKTHGTHTIYIGKHSNT